MIIVISLILLLSTLFFLAFLVDQQANLIIWTLKWILRVYDGVTLPIYILIDKPWRKSNQIIRAEKFSKSNYTYWENTTKTITPDNFAKLECSIDKLEHLSELLSVVKDYDQDYCCGRRKIVRKLVDGKTKLELGEYEWSTYHQFQDQINKLVSVLHHKFKLRKDDRVAIMADTCQEYLQTFFAIQILGCQLVALHSVSDKATMCSILNSTKPKYLFTQADHVEKLNELHPTIQTVSTLILFNNPLIDYRVNNETCKYELFEYDTLLSESQAISNLDLANLKFSEKDTAVILYTSGTNGTSKAVILSHSNLINSLKSYIKSIPFSLNMNNDDTVLAYLPMSHIFEMLCQIVFFTVGCKIAFSRPETLLSDLQASKASFWAGVPLIFEKFKNQIQLANRTKSSLDDRIHKFIFDYKNKWTSRGFECRLVDSIFFEPIQKQLGGNLKYIITGGAPLSLESQIFIKQCLNVKLLIVYASSECSVCGLSVLDNKYHSNAIGLQNGVKLRLENWSGYSINDKPNPRGELVVGSKSVTKGYFEEKEEIKKSFFEQDGIKWFRSGDIGEIDENGQISIIDRKSNLVKLQTGKYISLSKIESVLKNSLYIEDIVIHVNSFKNNIIGIVEPNIVDFMKLAESMGIQTKNLDDLCKDKRLVEFVLKDLMKYGRNNGLTTKEIPILIIICPDKWSPKNGLLSSSLKAIRIKIYERYEDRIKALYSENWEKFQNF